MKISCSDHYLYHHTMGCQFGDDCRRNYCKIHRYLWHNCESYRPVEYGDSDVTGGIQSAFEFLDCPVCTRESELRRFYAKHLDH